MGWGHLDADEFMPSPEAVERLQFEIDAYNARRPEISREKDRRKALYMGGMAAVFVGLTLVGWAVIADFDLLSGWGFAWGVLCAVSLLGAHAVAVGPAQKFQQHLRSTLFSGLFPFIQDLKYRHRAQPLSYPRLPAAAAGRHNRRSFDDVISGTYNGFSFELYEAHLKVKSGKSSARTVFQGVVVGFQGPRRFPGTLIATKAVGEVSRFLRDLFGGGGLEAVKSGDALLDTTYEFRSDMPDIARPLVNGDFARALDWMREAWPGEPARVALRGDDVFLLMPMKKNCFELPAIGVPLSYEAHVRPIAAELAAIMATAALVRKAIA